MITRPAKKLFPVNFTANYTLYAGLITGLGLVLRLVGLGDRRFWFDEAISAVYATQDVSTLFALNQGDNHPFGYYLALKFWIDLFGNSETAIRLLSALAGTASLWLAWLIGKRLFSNRPQIALTALLIMAINPFQVYFSQEARNYAFMQFFVLLAGWFWLRGLENNRWRDWIGLGLAGALGIICNFTTAFYLAALLLWPLWNWRTHLKSGLLIKLWAAGAGGGLLAGLALLPKLTNRLSTIKGNFWIPTPDPLVVTRTFFTFIFGAIQPDWLLVGFALALILLLVVIGQAVAAFWKKKEDSGLARTLWLLFAPLGLVIFVSLLFQPLYLDKALIACSPFYYLLIGWSIFRPDIGKQGKALLTVAPLAISLVIGLISLPALYTGQIQPLFIVRYNAPQLNTYLNQHPADGVVTLTDITWLPLRYYNPGQAPQKYPLAEYPYPNIFPLLLEKLNSQPVAEKELGQKFNRFWAVFEINPPEGPITNPREADLTKPPVWTHSLDWQQQEFDKFNRQYRRVAAVELDRALLVLYETR